MIISESSLLLKTNSGLTFSVKKEKNLSYRIQKRHTQNIRDVKKLEMTTRFRHHFRGGREWGLTVNL